jgi:hypothetical protein
MQLIIKKGINNTIAIGMAISISKQLSAFLVFRAIASSENLSFIDRQLFGLHFTETGYFALMP